MRVSYAGECSIEEAVSRYLAARENVRDVMPIPCAPEEGYRTAEIAALTGVPSSTVRSHLSEARALLKTMLGGERHGR